MKLQTSITRKIDDNYVQVEVQSKNQDIRYYKVPEAKADSFQKEYVKNSKRASLQSNLMLLGAIIATIVPMHFLTKKIENTLVKSCLGVFAGIAGGVGSMYLSANISAKSHTNMLQKYEAEEIDFEKQKLPI